VLHDLEQEDYKGLRVDDEFDRAARYLASRWAFKEAMVKASGNTSLFYPGMYLMKPTPAGKPIPTIEGEKNTRILYDELKVSSIHASLSHEDHFAVAFVLFETLM